MKTNVSLPTVVAFAIALMSACGGGSSPVSPTPLASRGSTAASASLKVAVLAVSPSDGPTSGGTEITITGTDFAEGATVSLGDAPAANVMVATSGMIVATTPPHAAGPVDVVVVNPDSEVARLEAGFSYGEPMPSAPAPKIFTISPSSGPTAGGTEIMIAGADFAEGAMVSLGDTPATNVVVASGELITAATPAHAEGLVDVIVINPDGQAASLGSAYTYLAEVPMPSTAPAIRSVMPSSGPVAGGTEIMISGTGFAQGATVSFGDASASNVVVASSTVIRATTPPHAEGTVDIVVTNPDGQSGDTLGGGYTFTAEDPPALTTITITSAGVSPKEVEIAVGSRVVFVNEDAPPHDMNSDPHPQHSDCREINAVGFIQPGQSKQTGEFRTVRTCGFHDHNQPSNENLKGRIVIR